MGSTFEQEYDRLLVEVIGDPNLPVVTGINVGHAMPRCILPFGLDATVDLTAQTIRFAP